MSKKDVKNLLESMGPALRSNRQRIASDIIQNPDLFPYLLKVVFETNYKLHYKAAWTLELILEKDIHQIIPHFSFFSKNIHKLKHESAIRPIAKICKWIAEAYVKKRNLPIRSRLQRNEIEKIVETGFDWMITNTKVAAKVYTMNTLYYFGSLSIENFEWIHKELKNIILQDSSKETAAYKAHAKKILKLLN